MYNHLESLEMYKIKNLKKLQSIAFDERVLILKFKPDPSSRSADISRTIFLEPLNAMGFRGRKPKQKRNTAGLRNHKPANTTSKSPSPVLPQSPPAPATSRYSPDWPSDLPSSDEDSDDEWKTHLYTEDGLKSVPHSNIDSEMEPEGEDDYTLDSVYLDDEVLLENLLMQADDVGDAVSDDDEWVPRRVHYDRQRRKQEKKARGPYKKGPDIGSKSDRTKCRYRDQIATQQALTQLGFSVAPNPKPVPPSNAVESMDQADGEEASDVDMLSVHSGRSGAMSVDEFDVEGPGVEEPNDDEATVDVSDAADSQPSSRAASPSPDEEGIREMEAEFDTLVSKAVEKIKDWVELREQIKLELKKKGKGLPLSKMNQLTIIRNFATLRLKGFGRMAASKEIARQWHEGEGNHFARQVCSVKPAKFRATLNDEILPATGVHPKSPLSERTARRWLIKLGFRRTVDRKGVYVDEHERPDVVKYRNEVFLPQMAEYERQMTQYILRDGELVAVPPKLADGEKEIIAEFHDECCFHAFDFLNSVWLGPGQQ
ncbi:hypothetical protein DFH09DRAFT_1101123 [Mycena vulgaris]|nr:hypothetical protein DFH09DRAFT_1101123 [Mycena vulgaris]